MKKYFIKWIEEYLYFPTPFQTLIGILLLPFTVIYCVITAYNRVSKKPIEFGIPIISVGNLLVGGTGKTPITISLAKRYKRSAVVLRGYKRASKGLIVVSDGSKILESIDSVGDEAMLLAKSLPNSVIIVSEDRKSAIVKAIELGSEVVFLDDGYRHHDIKKLDILLRPKKEPTNIFCLPTGGYRDTKMMYSFADVVLKEGEGFTRKVHFEKDGSKVEALPNNSVLFTAISQADRLFDYLPPQTSSIIFEDHYMFVQKDIENFQKNYPDCALVTTQKDYVKLEQFHLELDVYLMVLDIEIKESLFQKIDTYIKEYKVKS